MSSFKAEFLDDSTLEIEWDVNDPEFAFLNDMTDEEREKFIVEALERFIEQEKEEEKYLEHLIR
jgi:hypothetical protein